jgi:branched-chain amino acid transport system substrate-binding protein
VLGNVGTYSGVVGSSTSSAQPMLQVWAKWVNAHGGLSGHPVQVISADDGANPSTSLSLTQQMVQQNHVVAFLDNVQPLTLTASLNYLQQQGIPVVGGDVASPTWNQNSILFPQGTEIDHLYDNGMGEVGKITGKTKLGVLYCVETPDCTNAYTALFQNGGAKAAGLDPTYSAQVSLTQPDFTVECQQAQSAGVQILLGAVDADSLQRLARNCNSLGYDPQYVAFSLVVVNGLKSDPNLNGLLAPTPNFPWFDGSTPATAQYLQAVQQYDPTLETSAGTAAMWAAGALLAQAVANLNGAAPTSANIIKGLDAIQHNDLGGVAPPLSFAAGQPAPPASCYFINEVKSGAWIAPEGDAPLC